MAKTTYISDPLNIEFNEWRIRMLGERLRWLRRERNNIEQAIQNAEIEISERTRARNEHNQKAQG